MLKRSGNTRGFTLIEVISVTVLVGIMAAVAGMGLVQFTKGFVFAKDNAVIVQKAQAAMSRLEFEFRDVRRCQADGDGNPAPLFGQKHICAGGFSSNSVSICIKYYEASAVHTVVTYNDTEETVTIDGDILIDDVTSFVLTYWDNSFPPVEKTAGDPVTSIYRIEIQMEITLEGRDPVTFTSGIFLREPI